ncbi:MAG: leucine-rich repeat domain-containing protein, partial [Anaeroplasmataceae bacterium]|nr:leucine-rich repeat domain-containing protein [Anaeroplasmataceae bacterium]
FLNCTQINEAFIPTIAISHIGRCASHITITGGDTIESNAFNNRSNILSITINDGVKSILEYAFQRCSNLTSIIIPDSVETIEEMAFYKCDALQYNLYENGHYLGNENHPYQWFIKAKNTNITSCTIHQDTKYIYSRPFENWNSLTTVVIPKSVVSIAKDAFTVYCYNLSNAYYEGDIEAWCNLHVQVFPDRSISNHFFLRNSDNEWEEVKNLVIPDTITEISDYQFFAFNSLTSISIPSSVKAIGKNAFYECTKLEKIQIEHGVESIGNQAFYYCKDLLSIELPDSINSVGNYAFSNCSNLKYLIINKGVKEIGKDLIAFTKVDSIYFKGTEEEWKKISIDSTNAKLDSVTKYFYSETAPTEQGNYWHYVDEIPTKW